MQGISVCWFCILELYYVHWLALVIFWWSLKGFLCRGSCHLQTVRVLLLLFQFGFLLFLFLLWLLKAFLSCLAILWNSAFKRIYLSFSPLPFTSLLFTVIFKASSDNSYSFLHLFFLGVILITASCIMSQTSVHSSSGTLSIRSNPLNLFLISTV